MFCKEGVLRNFAKFTGKYLCQSLFFNIVVGLRPATFLKKRQWHSCFPINFVKFLRTFLTEHLRWLLLYNENFAFFKVLDVLEKGCIGNEWVKPYKKHLKLHKKSNPLTTVQFGQEHVLVSEFDEACVDHNQLESSIF